jgi:splicing factor 3B subunit 2
VLYDAFFKHQRKPKMSALGELYYEGKEYEARLEHLRPGVLSGELREALGMSDATSPPPWLVNMQVGGWNSYVCMCIKNG